MSFGNIQIFMSMACACGDSGRIKRRRACPSTGIFRMASIEALAATLRSLAAPGMTPKALRAALREKHPDASRKDVVRAAFCALIAAQARDGGGLNELHSFALAERLPDDETSFAFGPRRTKARR